MDVPVATAALLRPPPVALLRPARQTTPLVFASPHSGRSYPIEFVAAAAARSAPACAAARTASSTNCSPPHPRMGRRCWRPRSRGLSATRTAKPWELDPAMFEDELPAWVNTGSAARRRRAWAPSRGSSRQARRSIGEIALCRRDRPRPRPAGSRSTTRWARLIEETRRQFGVCLLIDCHSMPAHGLSARDGPSRRFRARRRARDGLRPARHPSGGGDADRRWATRCGATTPMRAATSRATTAARARACRRCRSRSRATSTWTRLGSSDGLLCRRAGCGDAT